MVLLPEATYYLHYFASTIVFVAINLTSMIHEYLYVFYARLPASIWKILLPVQYFFYAVLCLY